MTDDTTPVRGSNEGMPWEVRPEWLAGQTWWRIYVGGHPKALVRYRDNGVAAAEVLAADEAQFRRSLAQWGG